MLTLLQCLQHQGILILAIFSLCCQLFLCEFKAISQLTYTITKFRMGLTQCGVKCLKALRDKIFLDRYFRAKKNQLSIILRLLVPYIFFQPIFLNFNTTGVITQFLKSTPE